MEDKKILLLSANTYRNPYPVYPIGISYLKTSLANAFPDRIIDVCDMNFETEESLRNILEKGNYTYVGIGLRNIDDNNLFEKNSFVCWYRRLTHLIRQHSRAVLIGGGAGYSIFPEILFRELRLDYGIRGEGEQTLPVLVDALENGRPLETIEGLVYRKKDGSITVNPRTKYITSPSLRFEEKTIRYYWDQSGMLNIQTKRGCPFRCIYCSYPLIEGRRIRLLDSREVVATLEQLYREKGIDYVFFTDSVFNIDAAYNEELARRLIESGIRMRWGAYFSPGRLTKAQLALYRQAGLTHIEFGTDSFSDRQLEVYRKGFTWHDVREKSAFCDELGIFYAHFMILAGYGETEETLSETFAHSAELRNTVIFPYIGMRIYPETELFERALQEGRIAGREALLDPVYYVSDGIEIDTIKPRALATGAKWVFPDDASEEMILRFRAKKRRGPLWEYFKYLNRNENGSL